MKRNSLILVPLIIIILAGLLVFRQHRSVKPAPPSSAKLQVKTIPQDWVEVAATSDILAKYEKKSAPAPKPLVVVIKSLFPSSEYNDPAVYVDSLLSGAKSTVTGIKIISDKTLNPSAANYIREIESSYGSLRSPSHFLQRIYIAKGHVFTLTGSFKADTSSVEEINSVFDSVSDKLF